VRRIHLKNVRFSNDIIAFEVYEKESIQQLKYLVLKNKKARKTLIINLKPSEDETIVINLQELLHHALTRGRWQIFFSTGRVFGRKTALQISPKDFGPSAALTSAIPMTDEIGCAFFSNQSNDVELVIGKYQQLEEKLYLTEIIDLPVQGVELEHQELCVYIPDSTIDFHDVTKIILHRKKKKRKIICTEFRLVRDSGLFHLKIRVPDTFVYHHNAWDIILESRRPESKVQYHYVVKLFQESESIPVQSFQILDSKLLIELKGNITWKPETALLLEHNKNNRFSATIPVTSEGPNYKLVFADLKDFLNQNIEKSNEKWDLYLVSKGEIPAKRSRLVFSNDRITQDQFTTPMVLNPVVETVAALGLDKNQSLFLFVGKHTKFYANKYKPFANVKKIRKKDTAFELDVLVNLSHADDYHCESFVLKHRTKNQGKSYTFPALVKKQRGTKKRVIGTLDLNALTLEPTYWDLFIQIRKDDERFLVRVMNLNALLHHKINTRFAKYTLEKSGHLFYPYSTVNNQLSFTYREKGIYDSPKFVKREIIALCLYFILQFYLKRKKIWLIFEKYSETAQDNSFYFFKYCIDQQKTKNVYYVIKKDSPDYKNLSNYEKYVLDFMSVRHLLYLLAAKLLISSEAKAHAYIWRANRGIIIKQLQKKKGYIFLQHGVTALKRTDITWKKSSVNGADLFIVTSQLEKEIIKKHFHYSDNDIITTGFSRWDYLEDHSKESKEILLMPTWRNWLDDVPDEKFIRSDYFINYSNLLNSDRFQRMLLTNNITLNFYIHPKFMQYIDQFVSKCPNINIIRFGELPVNKLLMRSRLLITDYSSVSWDMYYMGKPVIFFQFDIDKYNFYHGSYLDMDKDLFGDRVFTIDELINVLKEYIGNEFKAKPEFQAQRKEFFQYIDKNNSQRIYDEIIQRQPILYRKETLLNILKKNELLKIIWKNMKSDKRFHPIVLTLKKLIS